MSTNEAYDETNDTKSIGDKTNGSLKMTRTERGAEHNISEEQDAKTLEDQEDNDNPQCGWFSWRPRFAQFFNSPKGFLFFICMVAFAQGMTIFGFVFISISTIERRFSLPSVKSGWIASTYDLTVMSVIVFVTYFGEKRHKPKFLAIGALIFALGNLIFSLPHFLTGVYRAEGTELDTCEPSRNSTDNCLEEDDDLSKYYPFFIAGQVLHGLGSAPLYTLGITHMDENFPPHLAAVYLGVFQTAATLGPSCGYLIGGFLLDVYTDFTSVDVGSLPIGPESPLWIGAWWMGFLISCGLSLMVIIPMSGFAIRLPGALAARRERIQEVRAGAEFEPRAGLGVSSLKDFPRAVLSLFRNPTYVLIDLAVICEWFIWAFISVFGPKYFESVFNISAGNAALVAGLLVTPASVVGNLLGGYLVKRFQLTVSGMLKMTIGLLTAGLLIMFMFLLTCPNVDFAGVTVQYQNITFDLSDGEFNLTASCNANCKCDTTFDPVCGSNDIMYYSSCHAGCAVETVFEDGGKTFSNCSCISDPFYTFGTAELGRCREACNSFIPFLILMFFLLVATFCVVVPSITSTLRVIDYDQRSFAMGFQSLLARVGSIPGPIIVGAVIDSTCLVWEYDCFGAQTCWMYDNRQLSFFMLAFAVALRIGSILLYSGALLSYKPALKEDKPMTKEETNTAL